MKKEIGVVGLGKMGSNIVLNLLSKKFKVVAFNRSPGPTKKLVKCGVTPIYNLPDLPLSLSSPRVIVIMVPEGEPVDEVIYYLSKNLKKGDILIDGGNSFFRDSMARYKILKKKGISYVDMGTSGGLEGARHGASLMIGGDKKTFNKIEPLFKALAVKNGYGYMGPSGSGHFVKMVHNGIEYSLLEAYGEGFGLLEKSPYKLDYAKVSRVWNNGSVIRSWLTELAEKVFTNNPRIKSKDFIVGGGKTGLWSYEFAKSVSGDVDSLKHALKSRKLSRTRGKSTFSDKLIALIRHEFGGHKLIKRQMKGKGMKKMGKKSL